MFFEEYRANRREKRLVKGQPNAETKNRNLFFDQIMSDRYRLARMAGYALIAVGVVWVVTKDEDNSSFGPEVRPVPESSEPLPYQPDTAQVGDCLYDYMFEKSEQTRILQEYLRNNGYYAGDVDGHYDGDVYQAVWDFQTDAESAGSYSGAIDGKVGYFTCMAMGEPYFIEFEG
jgi:hypothetical protein